MSRGPADETEALRAAIREGHELLKDLKLAGREVQALIGERLEATIRERVQAEMDRLGSQTAETITAAERTVIERFDRLERRLMHGADGKPGMADVAKILADLQGRAARLAAQLDRAEQMAGEPMVCRTCQRPLDRDLHADGSVTWLHGAPVDHPAEPVPMTAVAVIRGRCDFCGAGAVAYTLPVRDFPVIDAGPRSRHISRGGWAACPECSALIAAEDWPGVTARAVKAGVGGNRPASERRVFIAALHAKVAENATGPLRPANALRDLRESMDPAR